MNKIVFLLFIAAILSACQPVAASQPTPIPPTAPPPPPPTAISPPPPPPPTAVPPTAHPTFPPTSVPVEVLADSVNDIIGHWSFESGILIAFRLDGTYKAYIPSEIFDQGNYTFDAGKLTWVTSKPSCNDQQATYQVFVSKQEGKPAWLRLEVVGSDPCTLRAHESAGTAKFIGP